MSFEQTRFRPAFRPARLAWTAIGIAAIAIAGSAIAGSLAYQNSRLAVMDSVARNNLSICKTIVSNVHHELSQLGQANDKQRVIDHIAAAWERTERPYPETDLCVIEPTGKLALHTGDPLMRGKDVSGLIVNPDSSRPMTVAQLMGTKKDLATRNTNMGGQAQIVGYAYVPSIDSLVLAHVPAQKVNDKIRESALPWMIALGLVGGLLIPLSVGLLHRDYTTAQRAVEAASATLQANEQQLREENQLLAAVASGMPLDDALLRLVQFIEAQSDDVIASILLCSRHEASLCKGAAPGLTAAYNDAVDGIAIAEGTGSCGTAAFRGESVYTEDIEIDPRWDAFREIARTEGIRACWSMPIKDVHGSVLGTFAMYRRQPGLPTTRHCELLDTANHLASLLLSHHRHEQDLRESEARFRTIFEQAAVGVAQVNSVSGVFLRINRRYCEILGMSAEEILGKPWMELTHPNDLPGDLENMERMRAGDIRDFAIERRLHRSDGSLVWINLTVSAMWQPGEEPSSHIAIVEDITVRKRAEIDLRLRDHAFASSTNGIVIVDAAEEDLPIIYCNPAFERLTGYPQNEALGRNCRFLQGADRDQAARLELRTAVQDGCEVSTTIRNYRKDGTMFWCELHISPVHDADGCVTHFLGFQYDVTERKEAEQALFESGALYADLYENAPDMMASIDPANANVVQCNRRLTEVLGRPKEQILGRPVFDILSSESAEKVRSRIFPGFVATGCVESEELTLNCADGTTRDVVLNATAVRDAGGVIINSRSVLRDVTDQKKAEMNLAESEARLRAIFDSEPECVKLINAEGELLDMNPAGLAMIEADSLEQVVNQKIYPLVSPQHREEFRAMHRKVMGGEVAQLQFEIVGLKGTRRWMDTHATPMRDANGDVTALLSVTRDITDAKRAAEALRRSEELFRRLVETAPFGVRRNDLEGRITFANKALGSIFACEPEDMVGEMIWNFAVDDQDREQMQTHFRRHVLDPQPVSTPFEARRRGCDGRIIDVTIDWTYDRDQDGKIVGLIVIITDITARKKNEQERRQHREALAQMTRLSTMGELVTGIAHEVKQPLYAITNFATAASVSLRKVDASRSISEDWLEEMKAWNNGVHDASKRANEIIQCLREFARKGKGRRDRIRIGHLIRDSIELVTFEARQCQVMVETEFAEGLADIVADRIQCEQVLVNLLHNAFEALADHDAPCRVIIRAVPCDDFVEFQIVDNGPGIPADQHGKLFEAFYTTKPTGMGMGLAISQTIVEDHGGRLWGRANPQGGATFHFTLPVVVKQQQLQLKDA